MNMIGTDILIVMEGIPDDVPVMSGKLVDDWLPSEQRREDKKRERTDDVE